MNRILSTAVAWSILGAAGALLAADFPAAPPAPRPFGAAPRAQPATRQSDRERYAVLTEHNIFLKNRRSYSASTSTSRPVSEMDRLRETPEASYVLTGVVFEDKQYRAFLEDVRAGKVLRLSVGEPIARGKIASIDIDSICYESGGKQVWIGVGTTLTGIPYSAFASSRPGYTGASTGPTTGPASTPLPDPNNPNLTIEERMKLRRAMEMKK